jgi:hypothetical protein
VSVPILGEDNTEPELDAATKERLAEMGEKAGINPEPDLPVVQTAFLIVLGPNGEYSATHELGDVEKFRTARPAGGDDIIAGCSVVLASMKAQQTAVLTQQIMMQSAQMMAQKQQEAKLMQGIDPSKLRV